MNINEATDFFKSQINRVDKKSEIKIYQTFIGILSNLKNRDLTKEELQSIENELDFLALKANPKNRKKYFKQKLAKFQEYLKDKLSLISEGYYTAIGMSLGVCFGAAFGAQYDMSMGVSLGMLFGLIIGQYMDTEAEKQNRGLK